MNKKILLLLSLIFFALNLLLDLVKHCPVLSGRVHQKEEAYRQLRLQQSLEHDELDDDMINKLNQNSNSNSATAAAAASSSVQSQFNTTLGGHLVKK